MAYCATKKEKNYGTRSYPYFLAAPRATLASARITRSTFIHSFHLSFSSSSFLIFFVRCSIAANKFSNFYF
ncbi:MAG: hypothetical protein A3D96_04685 [Chlamydiae bacterium RIFCSPHIGHO2_12_FULL_44_59]|nr:MAG: hypothetical protein A2796_01615 [Chlamydiae bacterium RIFCSPHIGHO2_01_FULL_44_39]OGN58604.1 MAG: hypothetical protein A3C42_01165 [Chlamydiae bacterium RIFCSPHIGHO2_02_FULL_45_9]OGN61046.1 MAG: hypothetical protein A3D96_04685 [Chlamydiae bacterium RIFCSPHIGHO2_12_FULL_44_59]OGN66852.1 MAG: hypothetical protein A2978_01625 [Chlamydiae bacterium RIFCSPLOWO2_01_FULL_44_52]OGN68875.1 MAG: hypothetical protein A3F79_03880 [Chlamydiae bacterium RIFCSPLOWO2_12_FULL_45_20]